MANLDFFGAHDDLANVLEFLFSRTDLAVFESYSSLGEELKQFHSIAGLEQHYHLGMDHYGNGSGVLLQLWSPSVMAEPDIRRITLNPRSCKGHTFRYCIEGGGLIQLYFGGIHEKCITKSHYGHFSEKGARVRGRDHGVDWKAHAILSRKNSVPHS